MTPAARLVTVVLAPSVSMANKFPAVIEPALSMLIALVMVVCWLALANGTEFTVLPAVTTGPEMEATMPRFAPQMLPLLLTAILLST